MKVKLVGGSKRLTIAWKKNEKRAAGVVSFDRGGKPQEVPDDVGKELCARSRGQKFVEESPPAPRSTKSAPRGGGKE